jgi:hypothetical protein
MQETIGEKNSLAVVYEGTQTLKDSSLSIRVPVGKNTIEFVIPTNSQSELIPATLDGSIADTSDSKTDFLCTRIALPN